MTSPIQIQEQKSLGQAGKIRTSSSKTVAKTVKLTELQSLRLKMKPYSEAPGELIRILLEDFFNGLLPIQHKKYLNYLALRAQNERKF